MTASVLIHDRGNCEGPVTVPRRSFHMTSHRQGGIMPAVRLAAIDVGSNSLHMLVADVSPDGRIQVVDRLKEMVRLGRRAFTSGKLDREAAELALRTLKTFERLARARHVERLGAVATSAVREARNGAAFVRLLRRETGIPVRIISGPDEARLIFRAARHALGLDGGPHLLVDVGGGSVELVLVRDGRALWMRSLPLGVARLTERFLIDDPPRTGQVRQLEKHLRRELGEVLARVRRAGTLRAIGTSGTVNALVAMACAARGEDVARLHGARARAAEIARLRQRILGAGAARRASLPGIDTKRVDLMPAAVVLLDLLLGQARIPELMACTWALREGLLLELAGLRSGPGDAASVRRRSVEALAERFAGPNAHGRQVARLALALFDATADELRLPPSAREPLGYAACSSRWTPAKTTRNSSYGQHSDGWIFSPGFSTGRSSCGSGSGPRRRCRARRFAPEPLERQPAQPPAPVSGAADRGRRRRRIGQVHPAPPPPALARGARLPGALHGVELLAAGPALDEAREEEGPAHADDLQPAARGRLRRSSDLPDHAAAQGWDDRAGGSLRLHGLRP